ncbi:DUF3048 C-terminal domain-containing protein, partial [Paenibacillus xylanexedens]|uniref:DUF3048 C-terminal domain-containing protein n=1 Tax=Paenibacillus xylanexedens TaxID=528191 RepID=UPI0021B25BF4
MKIIVGGGDEKVVEDVGGLWVKLEEGGEGMLLEKGKMMGGEWEKKEGDIIGFVEDGSEVVVVGGKRLISIVWN